MTGEENPKTATKLLDGVKNGRMIRRTKDSPHSELLWRPIPHPPKTSAGPLCNKPISFNRLRSFARLIRNLAPPATKHLRASDTEVALRHELCSALPRAVCFCRTEGHLLSWFVHGESGELEQEGG